MWLSSPYPRGHLSLLVSTLALLPSIARLARAQDVVNEGIPWSEDDPEVIKEAAKTAAQGMMASYPGDQPGMIPGLWPGPYYWWEAGAAFGALVDYWFYTGNEEWVASTTKGLLHQVGEDENYMPTNQSKSLGNDDQCFWALATMAAAEKKFPDPPEDQPQWLALTQAVFNTQARRWDDSTCGGGLRWQIFTFNNGFNYKNTISNGCFFQLGARLARYTGNSSYAEWAEKTYDWTIDIKFINQSAWQFYDGAVVETDCTEVIRAQWSYNAGIYLAGAAYLYNFTNGSPVWEERINKILEGISFSFFTDEGLAMRVPTPDKPVDVDVMYEAACEPYGKCNVDQRSFKAYLARFMALTAKMAPYTESLIMPKLRRSAAFAAKRCNGPPGTGGKMCSLKWYQDDWNENLIGLGEQMAALEIFQNTLVIGSPPPVTMETGGTSRGDPGAGGESDTHTPLDLPPAQKGDKVGAGFLTTFVLLVILGGAWWMVV